MRAMILERTRCASGPARGPRPTPDAGELASQSRHAACAGPIYAFTRPDDTRGQAFTREVGAVWAGGSDARPPTELAAAIIFAPVGALVPAALQAGRAGGTVVCAGIHMSDVRAFPYRWPWEERVIRSVANLTRRDGEELLALAPVAGLRPSAYAYSLADVDRSLDDLRAGRFDGAAVVIVD